MANSGDYDASAVRSPEDLRDHVAEGIFPAVGESVELPDELDLRPWLPAVRNQGQTGTCAAHAAACMKEYQERRDVNFEGHLSPQFVYNLRSNRPRAGMHGRDVMRILHKHGIAYETAYPFGRSDAVPVAGELMRDAEVFRIQEYAQVVTAAGLKEALVRSGPCYISFPVYNHTETFYLPRGEQKQDGGHAVAVVGFNAEGFLLRNSWGRWGRAGYATYRYEHFGAHWEIWTTIDRQGSKPPPAPPPPEDQGRGCARFLRALRRR